MSIAETVAGTLLDRLSDKALLQTDSFIDGQWLSAESRFDISNPADNTIIASVSDVGSTGAAQAVQAATRARLTASLGSALRLSIAS